MIERKADWLALIDFWKASLNQLRNEKPDYWSDWNVEYLNRFHAHDIDESDLMNFTERWGSYSKDLTTFYSVTDGLPIFFGSEWASIVPAKEVGFFRDKDEFAYEMASAFSKEFGGTQDASGQKIVTFKALENSILISDSGCRELVLCLDDGSIILYLYDSQMSFTSFEVFMRWNFLDMMENF